MEENDENIKQEKIYTVEDLDLKQHSFILITSKRCSGKTVLVRHLLKYLFEKYEYDALIMFSDTSTFTEDYKFLDKDLIFPTEQIEEKLSKILSIQKKNITSGKKINLMILLDDIKIHAKSKELINLSTLGRHFLITTVVSSQYPK